METELLEVLCTSAKYKSTTYFVHMHEILQNSIKPIVIEWVPGHSGILGNKKYGEIAKNKALMQAKLPLKITANAYSKEIEKLNRGEWLDTWKNSLNGRKLF